MSPQPEQQKLFSILVHYQKHVVQFNGVEHITLSVIFLAHIFREEANRTKALKGNMT